MRRAALPLLMLAVVAAGCGSAAKSPSVASLGGSSATTTTTTSQAVAPPGGALSSGSGGGRQFQMKMQGGLEFSQCMRAHGVRNFPDPGATGGLTIGSDSGIDPSSSAFRSAQQACQKDLPNGGQPSPQQIEKAKKAALAFSRCMRAHGVKNFPDPNFSTAGGGIKVRIGGPGSGLDPNDPAFKRAQDACGGVLAKAKG